MPRGWNSAERPLLMGTAVLTCVMAVIAGAAIVAPRVAWAQVAKNGDIEGTWQGTLHAPDGTVRIVLRIAKAPLGVLSATMYSLDQGGQPIEVSSVRFADGELRFAIQFLGLTYEGRVAADGNSISGTMTQNGSYPLVLERATPETEWAIPAAPRTITAMAVDANPGIEVATVRPSSPDLHKSGMTFRGREIVIYGYTLGDMVEFCYDLEEKQLVNEPDWMRTARFDLNVLPDQPGLPSPVQFRIVVKKLLAERFGLHFHEEKKEMPVYVLAVANDGPKMTKSADPSESGGMSIGPLGLVRAHNMTMSGFAAKLQAMVMDRPVLDRTRLGGRWDFVLQWRVDESEFGGQLKPPAADDPAASLPSLFTAMREQLGLQLEPDRTQVPVLVIDHVDHPSPN